MEPELPGFREAGKRLRKLAVVGAALEVMKLAVKTRISEQYRHALELCPLSLIETVNQRAECENGEN